MSDIISTKIEDIQNCSLFVIAIYSLFSCLYYNFALLLYGNNHVYENNHITNYTKQFDILLPVVGLHAFIDFFLTKSYDIKLHHLCILGILFYNNYYNVSTQDAFVILYPLVKTEISSIFYVLKYWLPEKTIIYDVNVVLFYVSFVKLRIFDFYYEILYNNYSFDIVFQIYSQSNYYTSTILLLSCYGLYILNLYWFFVMNKMIYKKVLKMVNINTDALCHYLCSYLHWINIPLSYYIYAYNPNKKYIFDMIGITSLSILSYRYHNDVYRRLDDKQIKEYSIPNKDNIILFFNDNLAIHVRSFLVTTTNYYNSQYILFVVCISGINHISCIYCGILNMFNIITDYDKNKQSFTYYHNIFSAMPLVCDLFFICINSPIEISIPFLLVNIVIGILFMIEPFYKLTQVGFHVLLILQNYYMCLSNTK